MPELIERLKLTTDWMEGELRDAPRRMTNGVEEVRITAITGLLEEGIRLNRAALNAEPPAPVVVKALREVRRRLEWIAAARDDEDADLDSLCTYAEQALSALASPAQEAPVPAGMEKAVEAALYAYSPILNGQPDPERMKKALIAAAPYLSPAVGEPVAPIVINFLLECHCSAKPGVNLWPGGWNSSAGIQTRQWLKGNGLVNDDYRLTVRGTAWLDAILRTSLPASTEGGDRG